MKTPLRLPFMILGIGVALFAVFILAVNLYVQSEGMQNKIRVGLSDAVGRQVTFFRATFSPWNGFRLDKVSIESDAHPPEEHLLQAECLEVRCELWPLLRGRTVINRIILHSPVVILREAPPSPSANSVEKKLPHQTDRRGVTVNPEAIRVPNASGSAPAQKSPPRLDSSLGGIQASEVAIQKLQIRDGTFRYLNEKGTEICRLENLKWTVTATGSPNSFAGKLDIGKIVLLGYLEIGSIKSPVTLQNQKLHASKLSGVLAGGELEGKIEIDFSGSAPAYNVRLSLAKAQIGPLFPPETMLGEELTGKVRASLELQGIAGKEASNRGRMEIQLTDAAIGRIPILQMIGGIAGFNLGDLQIPRAETSAEILDSELQFQPSTIVSRHLQLGFSGRLSSEQTLNLAAQVILDSELFKKMPHELRANFQSTPKDLHVLDFTINGPLSAPQTDLQERLIGDRLPAAIRRMLGGKKTNPTPTIAPQ